MNLERPVTLLTRLGGHLVQGHVDGVGEVSRFRPAEDGRELTFALPNGIRPVRGGEGIDRRGRREPDREAASGDDWFGVALIPHTRR